jgi:pimeloyl-ACP methyl ester carboxylesterase
MPLAKSGGVRIYYEVEGNPSAEGLVMAHGVSFDLTVWQRAGYVDALKAGWRLVVFDSRGRGRSDKPHEPSAYDYELMMHDTLAVMDSIGIERAHYFGYSMGARIGFMLATRAARRFHSFILGGITPYAWPEAEFKPFRQRIEALKRQIAEPQSALIERERSLGRSLTPQERNTWLGDARSQVSLMTAMLGWPPLDDNDLAGISAPCLVFCGELDEAGFYPGARECVKHMPNARFVSLAGLSHYQVPERSDVVLPHVKEFLAEVNSA